MIPVEAIFEHDLLDLIAQGDVGLARLVLFILAIEAGPAHDSDLAGMAGIEAFPLHHASDFSVDAVSPVPVFFWRDSFTRLKALVKKSTSSACWLVLRSNSTIRRAEASCALPAGRGGFGTPEGRPVSRKPAAPSLRYVSSQRYSTLRLICNSSYTALTLSPLTRRRATASLNSWV